ncbi:MAG: tetratricopeptide repeat protein [Leptospiraceae bacterium]|nr:tetratricopeptide repeat protein [Leptospiraceae bacterium]
MKQLLTILLLTIALQGVTAEDIKKDYLSYKWAKYSFNNFWMKNITDQVSAKNEAAKLNAEGFKLYKSKKDKDAIPKYEAAIDKYPTGEVYYNYGNSLANVKRYEDSIKAYEIALKLDPPRPELALYNIACSYSLMNKPDNAYKYLASAVERGYNAFEYIKKDSDMANLRKQPDWETKLKSIKAKANYDESALNGIITEEGPRQPEYFYLCKSGVALNIGGYQIDCEGKGFDRGKWKLVNGDVKVTFQEKCSPEYVATPAELKEAESHPMYEGQCPTGKPKFVGCAKINPKENYSDRNLTREDVRAMFTPTSGEYVAMTFAKFKDGKEPKQCDPNFKLKGLKDYVVE